MQNPLTLDLHLDLHLLPRDIRQREMDPTQRQLDAKPLDCGLGSRCGSFTFVHDLEASTKTLLDPIHREVDAKPNNL